MARESGLQGEKFLAPIVFRNEVRVGGETGQSYAVN